VTIWAALTTVFNVFALNAVLVITCLPVVTAPLALQAGIVALDQWRTGAEDRVVVAFARAWRGAPVRHTMLSVGVPLVAAVAACDELWFVLRATHAHVGLEAGPIVLGLTVVGLVIAVASAGFVLVLNAARDDLTVTDLWYLSVALAARNVFYATPLLVGEVAVCAWLVARDPSLTVVAVPLLALALVRRTASRGIRRVEAAGAVGDDNFSTIEEAAGE
jgi:hypothetical protein